MDKAVASVLEAGEAVGYRGAAGVVLLFHQVGHTRAPLLLPDPRVRAAAAAAAFPFPLSHIKPDMNRRPL